MDDPFKGLTSLLPILVFLLPGFVSSGIVGMLVVRKQRETFDKCLEAFIFTAINLAVFTIIRSALELLPWVQFEHKAFFSTGNVVLMTACAIGIGLLWAYEATNEWFFQRLRDRRITRKTTKVSTWSETFVANQKFVIVHLKDDRRIYGWPLFYSDDPTERAVYLEKASWLTDDNQMLNTDRIGIFLDKESGVEFIEFLEFNYEQTNAQPSITEGAGQTATDRAERSSTIDSSQTPTPAPASLSLPESSEQTNLEQSRDHEQQVTG